MIGVTFIKLSDPGVALQVTPYFDQIPHKNSRLGDNLDPNRPREANDLCRWTGPTTNCWLIATLDKN